MIKFKKAGLDILDTIGIMLAVAIFLVAGTLAFQGAEKLIGHTAGVIALMSFTFVCLVLMMYSSRSNHE